MNIAIIGGGPGGIFSTLLLKNFPGKITLFEQNKQLGEKLRITGGGRMNITNKNFSADQFSSQNPRALKHLFKSEWVKNRCDIFNEVGVEYVWEKDRAILASGDAIGEVDRLQGLIQNQPNVQISLNTKVTSVIKKSEQFEVVFEKNNQQTLDRFDIVILSGGGMFRMFDPSLSKKGIYKLVTDLGHSITSLAPSLSPIRIPQNPFIDLSGTSMILSLFESETKTRLTQDAIFTHAGISGPVVLDFSASLPTSGDFEICFIPEITDEEFTKKFQERRQGSHSLRTFLHQWIPKKVVDWHIKTAQLPEGVNISDVSKDTLKLLRKNLFRFPIQNANTLDYPACWTTKGGVDLSEINVSTLESRITQNLYFAGEILDVNGLCGGFNISFATVSAKIVSEAILKQIKI